MMHFILFLLGLITPGAHAVTLDGAGEGGAGVSAMWSRICSTLPYCSLGPEGAVEFFTGKIIVLIFSIIGGVGIALIVYAGIRMIVSQGQDEALVEAKKIVKYVAIGMTLALSATAAIGFFVSLMSTLFS